MELNVSKQEIMMLLIYIHHAFEFSMEEMKANEKFGNKLQAEYYKGSSVILADLENIVQHILTHSKISEGTREFIETLGYDFSKSVFTKQ